MLAYLRLEILRILRNPRFTVFTVLMPTALYLVVTNIGAGNHAQRVEAATMGMVGMAVYGAIFAAVACAPGIVEDRTIGWLRQLRVSPLQPVQVVIAKGLASMIVVLPAIGAVCTAAVINHGIELAAVQWAALIGLLWLGAVPFALLALAIGYVSTPQTAPLMNLGVVMGMSLLGGLWIPVGLFPTGMQHVARALPTYRYAELGWRVAAGHAPTPGGVAILLAWCAGFAALAALAYRRAGVRA